MVGDINPFVWNYGGPDTVRNPLAGIFFNAPNDPAGPVLGGGSGSSGSGSGSGSGSTGSGSTIAGAAGSFLSGTLGTIEGAFSQAVAFAQSHWVGVLIVLGLWWYFKEHVVKRGRK